MYVDCVLVSRRRDSLCIRSVKMVLRDRRLRFGHMRAVSIGGMLGFDPTLQSVCDGFRSYLEVYLFV